MQDPDIEENPIFWKTMSERIRPEPLNIPNYDKKLAEASDEDPACWDGQA